MTARGLARAGVVLALLLGLASAALPAPVASAIVAPRRVYLVIATGLQWSDLSPARTPALWGLASEGALGNANAVVRTREAHLPATPLEGALDLSAGDWATPVPSALGGHDATEPVAGADAAAAYQRETGSSVGAHAIAFLGLPAVAQASAENADAATVGSLGQSVHDAGGVTVAIGTSDGVPRVMRPAAAAVMDERGLVDLGDVSGDLLAPDAAAFRVRTDLAAFERVLSAAEASASAHGGPALIALDPGDAYRMLLEAPRVGSASSAYQRALALSSADAVAAMALRHARTGDVVIVTGQAAPDGAPGVEGFSPLLVRGAGLTGYLTSASTHRSGIVTNPDVSAFVLSALGIARPISFVGTPLTAQGAADSPTAAARIRTLAARDRTAVAIIALGPRFATWMIALVALVAAAVALLLAVGSRLAERTRRIAAIGVQLAALIALAVPPACWAMFLVHSDVTSATSAWTPLIACTLALAAAAALAWRVAGPRVGLLSLPVATALLLLGDQLLGAPLSFTNLLGYSPLQGARFYGIGNEAAALLTGCTLLSLALALDLWPQTRAAAVLRRFGIPVLGALVVGACAAPVLGANIGVGIWGSSAVLTMWMRANGWRLTWRRAALGVLVIAVLVGGFVALDVLGPGQHTHLARTVTTAAHGGTSQVATLLARKASTNLRQFTKSRWPLMLLALAALLGIAWWLPSRPLRRLLAENPALGSALVAGAVGGVFALVTEDTGILVPTFLLLPLGLACVWLLAGATASETPASDAQAPAAETAPSA